MRSDGTAYFGAIEHGPTGLALPDGVAGIDAGLTLTKVARARDGRIELRAYETASAPEGWRDAARIGVTGARAPAVDGTVAIASREIDAAARGVLALMRSAGMDVETPFVLALLGTGTAFAAVSEGTVRHLGGTALGGGSFAGIARRIAPALRYAETIAAAARGERRNADMMVSDAYPQGIGRIGPDLTAAHLSKQGGAPDDVLAALLNLHGENIAQIGASRAVIGGMRRLVLAGGFVQDNAPLAAAVGAMAGMFGIAVDVAPWPGFAGALGAALIAAEPADAESG